MFLTNTRSLYTPFQSEGEMLKIGENYSGLGDAEHRFRIVRRLGSGVISTVYEVVEEQDSPDGSQIYALKVPNHQKYVDDIRSEGQILISMNRYFSAQSQ